MQPLLDQTIGTKNENLKSKVFRILTFAIAIASLIMSITGLSFANKGYLETDLFRYEFPNWASFVPYEEGSVVSLDQEGKVMLGAGTTITRDSYVDTTQALQHPKVWNVNDWLYVVAADNTIRFYEVDPRDISIEAKTINTGINVVDFLRMTNETFIIIGNDKLRAFNVKWTWTHETGISIDVTMGDQLSFPAQTTQAKFDTLDESHFCMVYETDDHKLYTTTGSVTYSGNTPITTMNTAKLVSDSYDIIGVAGLSTTNYIIASAGPQFNSSGRFQQELRAALVTINAQSQLTIDEWVPLPFSMSFSYFDMDNFDDRHVFVSYINGINNNGIECVLLNYERETNKIYWATSLTYQSGGAVLDHQNIVLSMLTPTRLALTYSDSASHGSLVLGMIELTPSGTLTRASTDFVLDRPSRESTRNEFHYDTCAGAPWRFVTVESFVNDTKAITRLHVGSYMPRPVGIVTKNLIGTSMIQFAGTVFIPQPLTPGYMYYGDDNGKLKRGRPAGFAHREFGAFYVVDDDNNVLSLHNQIGVALNEHEILIKLY